MLRVKCDNPGCQWSIFSDSILKYYKKPCPVCGHGPLINTHDLQIHRTLNGLRLISNGIAWFFGLFGFKHKLAKVSIDTGPARQGKPVEITARPWENEKPIYD